MDYCQGGHISTGNISSHACYETIKSGEQCFPTMPLDGSKEGYKLNYHIGILWWNAREFPCLALLENKNVSVCCWKLASCESWVRYKKTSACNIHFLTPEWQKRQKGLGRVFHLCSTPWRIYVHSEQESNFHIPISIQLARAKLIFQMPGFM